jgi:hypothetical protein
MVSTRSGVSKWSPIAIRVLTMNIDFFGKKNEKVWECVAKFAGKTVGACKRKHSSLSLKNKRKVVVHISVHDFEYAPLFNIQDVKDAKELENIGDIEKFDDEMFA